MMSISPTTFKQSTMEALFRRVPMNTTRAVEKFAAKTTQTERMLSMPILKGSAVDIKV